MEDESNKFSAENYIITDRIIVSNHSVVPMLHYNNAVSESAPNSFKSLKEINEYQNIKCEKNEDNLVILNEILFKYQHPSNKNIQIQSNNTSTIQEASTSQKAFSPTIFKNAVKVVKNLFSPPHGVFYRTAPPITFNDVDSRKKIEEEENIFSENISDKFDQSINFGMKTIETDLDGNECTYEVDRNQSVMKNGLNSIDSHNNTNDSYTTTVSRMDDSFQSTVTHFDDWIQVGGGELNEQILVENTVLDNSLNETLGAKNNSLNNTLIKNISIGALESEHINDTLETSVRCNTSCEDIQDQKFNFLQENFHASFAKANYGSGENELKMICIDNVPFNSSDESKKEFNALEKIKTFITSSGKTKEKLMLINKDKKQEKVVSMDISSSTLNSSRNFDNFDELFLDTFTTKSSMLHKKTTGIENVDTFSGPVKNPERICEVNIFFTTDNSSKIDCYFEKDEFDTLLEESEENEYIMDSEKKLNTNIMLISTNEESDITEFKNIAEEHYSGKPISPTNKLRRYKMYSPKFNNQKISGEPISDVVFDNQEDEKICNSQNNLSQMSLKVNVNEKSFTRNNIDSSKKLNIVNNTEKKNIMDWISDNQLHINASDKSNSSNIKSNLVAKEQCSSPISHLNFKTINSPVNQWEFQNDPQLDSLLIENKSEVNENRIPLALQKSCTTLYNLNTDLNQPVLLYYASDIEVDKLNDIALRNGKFMDVSVTYCKTDSDAQNKMQTILGNNIDMIDVQSDNSCIEIEEILPQQTIRDDRFAVEQTDINKENGTDANSKIENKNVSNKDSNLKHFTRYIESFTETKTGLELDVPISSPSQSLRTEKIIKILKLSENEKNIDSRNIPDHVKIIKMILNNELEKVNSKKKSNATETLSMDQLLEVTVKNSRDANILFLTRTLEDKKIWEENILIGETKSLLESISNDNSLKSLNCEENRFQLNHFEFEKAQPFIRETWKKYDAEGFFTKRDMNFHIIKKSHSNKQCSQSDCEYSFQGNETTFPIKNSFFAHEESTLGIKNTLDNLMFDVEGSAIKDSFKEENKNENLNLNSVAVSEIDIVKKFNDTLTSVYEINSSKRLENLDESQISGNNIDLSQPIQNQFTRTDVQKICEVVDDISNLSLCESISNRRPNFLNLDNSWNVNTSIKNDKTIDETHNFILDNESALSSSCLDFLGSIEGKPSKRDYSRESLFIKFDPLMQTKDSFNLLRASEKEKENLIVMPLLRNSTNEGLLPISPLKQAFNFSSIGINPLSQKNLSKISNVKLNKLQEMQNEIFRLKKLYVYREERNKEKINTREKEFIKLRTAALLLENKIKESENRGKLLVRKLNDQNESAIPLKKIVEEYFAYAVKLVKQFESIKVNKQKQIAALRKDRDCYATHLQNIEQAFSDVHSKYEKCKKAVEIFRKNENILKTNIGGLKEDVEICSQKIIDIEENTAKKLSNIQDKINEMKFHHAQEISRFKAQIRKNDLKVQTLQETLRQKIKENKELVGICDELIEGKK